MLLYHATTSYQYSDNIAYFAADAGACQRAATANATAAAGGLMTHVTYECVTSNMNTSRHTSMSHVTYGRVTSRMNESCHSHI